jgi:hypothetical protein
MVCCVISHIAHCSKRECSNVWKKYWQEKKEIRVGMENFVATTFNKKFYVTIWF